FSRVFFSSRRRHTMSKRDWSSDVCSSDLWGEAAQSDTFIFNAVPEDSTRIAELQTGDADLIFPLDPNDFEQIDTGEGTTVNETESVRMEYVGFNTEQEPFDDPVVRQAIAQAIDKEDIIDIMLEGKAVAADTLLSP